MQKKINAENKYLYIMKGIRTFSKKCLACLSLILLFVNPTAVVHAQTWPVSVSASMSPQFTGYWTDYSDPSSALMSVSVLLNDINLSNYQINLLLTIEGPDYTLTSSTPLSLNPGEINVLPSYTGFSSLRYQSGALFNAENCFHEGSYMLHIVAFDAFYPDRQVSNEVILPFYFALKDPPFLILPANQSLVTPLTPQFINFTWSATEAYYGDPSWTTSYKLSIYRVPPGTMDTMSIVNYGVPIFETDTNFQYSNSFILGPDIVELNPFSSYVWRVQATNSSGRGIYKNNGYSEAFTFKYGDPNAVIAATIDLDLTAQGISHRMGACYWSLNNVVDEYHLQVRKKGTQNWFDYYSTSNLEKINNLEPQTTYEARLRGEGNIETDWTDIKEFTTKPVPNYDCNNSTMPMDGLAANPLPAEKAHPGLIIQSGQFEVFATSVTPLYSPGHFSGEGYAIVFGVFPLAVEWQDIYINDNNRQMSGVIQAKTTGIDAWTHNWDVEQAAEDPVWVQGSIDSVWLENNQYCYTFDDGTNTQTVCNDYPGDANVVVIQDDDGNQYVVTIYPEPSSVSGPHNYLTYLGDNLGASDSVMVTFEAATNQQFGFDKKEHVEWILNYEPIRLSDGTNYFVPWKSIGKGQSDVVVAHAGFAGFDEGILTFKDKAGTELNKTGSGGTYTVSVPSNAECVYAWYGNMKLGKLNVVELDTLSRRVVVVPVNGATMNAASLQSELNTIYAQANVHWTVSTASSFSFDLGNDGLEAADATLFSKYSPEMRALRDSFRTQDTAYNKNAYYLFIVSNFSDPAQLGYMVRGRAAGFLSQSATPREAAHELGHGAFGLEHTFPDPAQGTTTNLMDYSTGTRLNKPQWEAIHSRMPVFNWLDEEEDGSAFGMPGTQYVCISDTSALNRINKYHVFYLPDGRIADLAGYSVTGFYTAGDSYPTARGALYSLDYEGKNIVHLFNKAQLVTVGYGYKESPDGGYTISLDDETIESNNTAEAVKVFVDQVNNLIEIQRNGQVVETFAFDGVCQCHSPQWLYFTENTAEQSYVSYYLSSGSPTTEAINNNTSIINQLVSLVNDEKNNSFKNVDLLGESLADKLRTYELFNNKKFIVVSAEVSVLDVNQNNWQSLAEKVFEQAALPDDAILITIPYVHGNDLAGTGHDVNMPGLAFGRNVNIQTTSLENNYSHIQNSSERLAGEPTVVSHFIFDVFKWTHKKAVIYQGIYNASNAIECAKYESNDDVGFGFNKTIRLYKHDGYEYLKAVIDEKNSAEHSMQQAYASNPNPIQLAESIRNLEYEYSLVYADELSKVAGIKTYSEFTPNSNNNIIYKEEFIESIYSGYDDNNAVLYITNKAFRELQEELEFPVANDFDYYASQTLNRNFFTDFVDPVVYKALDITSLVIGIILPGSDILPDGLGLIYSVIRMNTEEQLVYTLAVSIGSGIGSGFVIRNTFSGAKKNILKILKNNTVKEVDNISDEVLLSYVESQYTHGNFSNEVYLSLKDKRGQELKQGIEEVLGMVNNIGNNFDITAFKNVVAKTPGIDNASLTNLPKSFWDDAYKFLPDNSSPFKSQIDNIKLNGDPTGKLTEQLVEDIMTAKGYKVGNGRYYGEYETARNGIDGFFYKGDISNPTEIIVIDSKQMSSSGSVTLNAGNEATGLPIQMKEDWIRYIADEKLDKLNGLQKQTATAIQNSPPGFIEKYVAAIDKSTGTLKFLKLGNF